MSNRTKITAVILICTLFLAVFVGCGSSSYQDGYNAGYADGYKDGQKLNDGKDHSETGTALFGATVKSTGYIGNINSEVFHLPSCSYLPQEENRIYFTTRGEAIGAGYTPCGHCEP